MPTPEERVINAIISGSVAEVTEALKDVEDIDAPLEKYMAKLPPLLLAISKNRMDVVKLLVEMGADVNVRVGSYLTAYSMARAKSLGEIAKYLHKVGAKHDPSPTEKLMCIRNVLNIGAEQEGGNSFSVFSYHYTILQKILFSSEDGSEFKVLLEEIFEAYKFASEDCMLEEPVLAPTDYADRILERIKSGKLVCLPSGWDGHAVGISFCNGYLIFTNRGDGCKGKPGTRIYKIDNINVFDVKMLKSLLPIKTVGKRQEELENIITNIVGRREDNLVAYISQKSQKHGNCTSANIKSNLHGVMLALGAIRYGVDFFEKGKVETRKEYKKMTKAMREFATEDFVSILRDDSLTDKEKLMAKEMVYNYIKQHMNFSKTSEIIRSLHLYDSLPPKDKDVSIINKLLLYSVLRGDEKVFAKAIDVGAEPDHFSEYFRKTIALIVEEKGTTCMLEKINSIRTRSEHDTDGKYTCAVGAPTKTMMIDRNRVVGGGGAGGGAGAGAVAFDEDPSRVVDDVVNTQKKKP